MWAAVDIGVNLTVPAYCKQVQLVEHEAPALTLGQFLWGAQANHRGFPLA
jgi:hypothetical protein